MVICLYDRCFDDVQSIFRPEANTPIPQQTIHGRGGLTAYDTVAV